METNCPLLATVVLPFCVFTQFAKSTNWDSQLGHSSRNCRPCRRFVSRASRQCLLATVLLLYSVDVPPMCRPIERSHQVFVYEPSHSVCLPAFCSLFLSSTTFCLSFTFLATAILFFLFVSRLKFNDDYSLSLFFFTLKQTQPNISSL